MSKKAEKRRHKRLQQSRAAQGALRKEARRAAIERVEMATGALRQLIHAAADDGVAPNEVAQQMIDSMAGDPLLSEVLLSPEALAGLAHAVVEGTGAQRASAVAAALEQRLDDHPDLAWAAVSLAEHADDLDTAARLAERSLSVLLAGGAGHEDRSAEMACALAGIHRRQGRLGTALEDLEQWCERCPGHDELQELRAVLLAQVAAMDSADPGIAAAFPDEVAEPERASAARAVERFNDRSLLYRLRDAVEAYIQSDRGLALLREERLGEFAEEVGESAQFGAFDEPDPAAVGLAAEKFWVESVDEDDDEDVSGGRSVLRRFAADPGTPADLAAAAEAWFEHVHYGLWLGDWVAAPGPHRGIWVTDIVTRRRLYASIPPEQLEGVARWTVLAGAIAPVGGVWRSGQSLLALDPALADEAAESVLFVTEKLAEALAREHGMKAPRSRRDRPRRARPHAVMCELVDPMDRAEADLTAKVLGGSLPHLVAMAESDRRRAPAMRNTDGDPLELISAAFPVDDPQLLRRRLDADMDFDCGDGTGGDDEPVMWLGRLMTAEESANAMAQFRVQARQQGWGEMDDDGAPRRWTRGTLHFGEDHVRVEVNSRARLDAISAKLQRLGAGEPTLQRRIDPSMDLPSGGRLLSGRSLGPEADDEWMRGWIDEKVPALDGATPRDARNDPRRVVLLEKLLRQFEHDADVAAGAGDAPMDVDALRELLDLRDGLLLDDGGYEDDRQD